MSNRNKAAAHGGIRDSHVVTIRRGFVSINDCIFTQSDEGRLYCAFCECGENALGVTAAAALDDLKASPLSTNDAEVGG